MVSQNVQTDTAVRVDVGVVDAGGEVDLGRLKWVVGREVNCEEEDTSRVRRVTLDGAAVLALVTYAAVRGNQQPRDRRD